MDSVDYIVYLDHANLTKSVKKYILKDILKYMPKSAVSQARASHHALKISEIFNSYIERVDQNKRCGSKYNPTPLSVIAALGLIKFGFDFDSFLLDKNEMLTEQIEMLTERVKQLEDLEYEVFGARKK